MKKELKNIWRIIKTTIMSFMDDNPMVYSSAIAFYTIFSLPAILIIVVRISSILFGEDAVTGKIYGQINQFIGTDSATHIENILENAALSEAGLITTTIGVATLVFSATTVFTILQNSLNSMWQVRPKPEKGWLKLIRDRILSFIMVVSLGFLLLISLVLDIFLVIFRDFIKQFIDANFQPLMSLGSAVSSFVVVWLIFSLLFKVLPDVKIKWRDVWTGAFVTTALFTIGKYLIGFYLEQSTLDDTYGAAGSLVVILIWVNYSSVILLLGAEFTQVYSKFKGRFIAPSSHAVKIRVKELESEE